MSVDYPPGQEPRSDQPSEPPQGPRPDEPRPDEPRPHEPGSGSGGEPGRDPGHEPNPNEPGRGNPHPLLVLSYDDLVDDGRRPLPTSVVSWWSPALKIAVDGTPYTGGTLPRDRPTTIEVRVANWGDKDTSALVSLYWALPTPIFSGDSLQLKGLSEPVWVDVPRRSSLAPGLATCGPFFLTPSPSMPDHVCLLAEISAGDEAAPGPVDPFNNRHYAQHNVDIVHAEAGKMASFIFQLNNPFIEAVRLVVRMRALDEKDLAGMQHRFGAPARPLPSAAFSLQPLADVRGNRQHRELVMEMAAGERRVCHGLMFTEGMQPGEFSAGQVEVQAVPLRQDDRQAARTGALGVIVFAQ